MQCNAMQTQAKNAYEMYKFMKCCNLMKKIEKKINMKFDSCQVNVKNDGHTFVKSKFSQRMNEQLLNVSIPQSKSSFPKFENMGCRPPRPYTSEG